MSNDLRNALARSIAPRLDVVRYSQGGEYHTWINALVDDRIVGGFVAMDGDVDLVRATVAALQSRAGGGLMISADCEFGTTMRFPGGAEFPSMMALGVAGDLSTTYTVARTIALEMASMGLCWNFAPVADVNVNPENPIINIRSFGVDPEVCADHVEAYVRGTQDAGIIATAKHFPGHGDTAVDSHTTMPTLPHNCDRLEEIELIPFRRAITAGVRSVMTAHLAVPALDPGGLPASLSHTITTGLLRNALGFDGLVVTDALDMGAITEQYTSGDAALLAYSAGADVLIIPADPREAHAALAAAAERGEITGERIGRTTERIDAAWRWSREAIATAAPINRARHAELALEAARRTVRVEGERLPIDDRTFVLALVDSGGAEACAEWLGYLSALRPDLRAAMVSADINDAELAGIVEAIDGASSTILALFVRPRAFAGSVGLSAAQSSLAAHALRRSCALLCFGNPWLLRDSTPSMRIDTFGTGPASLAVAVERLG